MHPFSLGVHVSVPSPRAPCPALTPQPGPTPCLPLPEASCHAAARSEPPVCHRAGSAEPRSGKPRSGLDFGSEANANILAEQTAIPAERKANSEAALFKQSTRTCRGFYLLQEKLAEAAASSALPHPATRLPR